MNIQSIQFYAVKQFIIPFLAFFLSGFFSFSQTSLSGVINSYTAVSDIDYCGAALQVGTTEGFEEGMFVILIQMQGAEIRTDNSVNFGAITDLRNAGYYEKGEILSISNNTIYLRHSLIHEYNLNGSVQLITMPSYESAQVVDTLKAKPWDGTTGGILALHVTGTLTLDDVIDVSQVGFRGGDLTNYDVECTGLFNNANAYVYAAGDWRGAGKGEGIASFVSGRENGRGRQANGGGGGNDHNSGGGGGANVTEGGNGGRRETPLLALECKGDNPGLGGNALGAEDGRIFMGGGGGAGHSNNNNGSPGKAGGGIAIIEADVIVSNNAAINVSGGSAKISDGDGGGGGGAGGTVVILASQVQGDLLVDLKGGNGGSADNGNRDECFGPGGGGSGGYFLSNAFGNNVNVQRNSGIAGKTFNTSSSCNGSTNGAENGENGLQQELFTLPQGMNEAAPPTIVEQPSLLTACMESNAALLLEVEGVGISYQWQIDQGNGFENLNENITYAGVQTSTLTINNISGNMENHRFRAILSTECFEDVVSEVIELDIQSPPTIEAEYSIDGRTVTFTNSSTNFNTLRWDWDDGTANSTATNPTHTYDQDGMYTVILEAENDCGSVTEEFIIIILSPPVPNFTAEERSGCAPLSVSFTNESEGVVTDLLWLFPGGEPVTSTEANPSVTYSEGGSFNVILIVSNAAGMDSIQRMNYVQVRPLPTPTFTVQSVDHLTVTFSNTTINGQSYLWNFGDGNTSTEENPTHTYATDGAYSVTLTATNDCGSQTFTNAVEAGSAPTPLFTVDRTLGCAPLSVKFVDKSTGTVESWFWSFPGGNPATSTEQNPVIRYESGGIYSVSLTVGNTVDSITTTREELIQVYPRPVALFEYTITGEGLVAFTNLSQNATLYNWSFGDGTTSSEENPMHEFTGNGFYSVTLNALNANCGSSFSQSVLIMVTDIEQIGNAPKLSIFPNPAADFLNIAIDGQLGEPVQARLLSPNGQLLQTIQFSGNQQRMELQEFAQGLYLLQLIGEDWQVIQRVVKY